MTAVTSHRGQGWPAAPASPRKPEGVPGAEGSERLARSMLYG
ncbi:Hypothetical protein AA314_02198 [Archangium gephyra]|uniref:Uncharacterized protein n=1 Tax=Archangium gephyra TaxID=48 RepID=A0AAC8TC37_9BACT|nr:Hypothetical protein AA314_02198 [Archangium gephyra]